ncbi:MAG TPA: hypothetical protein VGP94_03025 [Tepidisphaeraceae bacterium]|jgi:hypothetical protein|nr:hypothetical protein [Tepidisphaeraceae bacterium]
MPTVLGIFNNRKHAEDVVLSLVEAGFERFDVSIVDDVPGLIEQGVPEEEARCYAEGIGRGGIVVAVRCFPEGIERAAEVMRKLGAVDVSAPPAAHKHMERIRPFGEMLEGSTRPMRAGETEKERRSIPDATIEHGERLGDMDRVYGGGIGQKGEETPRDPQARRQRSADKIQKDLE